MNAAFEQFIRELLHLHHATLTERVNAMGIKLDALKVSVDAAVAAFNSDAGNAAALAQAKADLATAQADAVAAQTTIDDLQARLAAATPKPVTPAPAA